MLSHIVSLGPSDQDCVSTPKGETDRCVMATWCGNKGCCARLGWLFFPSSLTDISLPHTIDAWLLMKWTSLWQMLVERCKETQGRSSHSHTLPTHLCASCSTLLVGGVTMPSIEIMHYRCSGTDCWIMFICVIRVACEATRQLFHCLSDCEGILL